MLQSPTWEANWFAASQEIPRISRNPKVHYRTHKRPPPVSILGQPNYMTGSVLRENVLPKRFCRIYVFGLKSLVTDTGFDIVMYSAFELFLTFQMWIRYVLH